MPDVAAPATPLLNPAQQRAVELLRTRGVDRPTYPADLASRLRAALEESVAEAVAELPEPLWVSKFALGRVHGCEVRFLHEDGRALELGPALVAGTVAHRAIQLSVTWRGEPSPLVLVGAAVERIEADDDRTGRWLNEASEAEHAEVLGMAAERVGKFLECFPPLRASWAPATESPLRAYLADGRVVLSGRVDLVLGRAQGMAPGKAFVDFKTGTRYLGHIEDLRFYALVETLRLGVPPLRLASYYLDGAVLSCEDVNTDMLEAASQRVADGVRKLVELRHRQREPLAKAGPGCRYCPVLAGCATGQAHLAEEDDG